MPCQAEVIIGDLAFICTRKHNQFSSGQVPERSTKPWVLIKLPAPTPDVAHCTADQHNPRDRIRPATSSRQTLFSLPLAFVATTVSSIFSTLPGSLIASLLCAPWKGFSTAPDIITSRTWTYLEPSTWNNFLYPSFSLALTLLA